jgi:hypothetical protein
MKILVHVHVVAEALPRQFAPIYYIYCKWLNCRRESPTNLDYGPAWALHLRSVRHSCTRTRRCLPAARTLVALELQFSDPRARSQPNLRQLNQKNHPGIVFGPSIIQLVQGRPLAQDVRAGQPHAYICMKTRLQFPVVLWMPTKRRQLYEECKLNDLATVIRFLIASLVQRARPADRRACDLKHRNSATFEKGTVRSFGTTSSMTCKHAR